MEINHSIKVQNSVRYQVLCKYFLHHKLLFITQRYMTSGLKVKFSLLYSSHTLPGNLSIGISFVRQYVVKSLCTVPTAPEKLF